MKETQIDQGMEDVKRVIAIASEKKTTKAQLKEGLVMALSLIEEAKVFSPEDIKKAKSVKAVLAEVNELIENSGDIDAKLKESDITIKEAIELRIENLSKLDAGIKLKQAEINELYDVEAKLQVLAGVVNTINAARAEQAEELKAHKLALKEAKDVFDETMESEVERIRLERKKDEDAYNYDLKIKQRDAKDAFKEELEEMQADANADLDLRSAELDKKQARVDELVQESNAKFIEAEAIKDVAEEAVAKAEASVEGEVAKATNALKATLTSDHKIAIMTKENEIALLENQLETAKSTIEKAEARAAAAEKRAEDAYKQLTEIASTPTVVTQQTSK